ncbi:cell division protein FtsQ/DivIB [Paenibacillus mendelii]|uniref:Cell division protein DivIB n=1 Tax=Paenibacillus mendelii TaxID=206163 RepID=A0ABV6JHK6_9BACL|nr:FtsQ-type POTRA domain-containing protein [Paenibacillus mendelii]MCQ6558261.1 FtsQ-type POTRA domain-containing protein [Paenibacillus mendelii]
MQDKVPVLREPVRKRRGGKKLLAVLLLLFIVILCVLFFNSSISKISSIVVEGQRYTSREEIQKAAGIQVGDAFFSTSAKTVEDRVKAIKPVEKVEVVKKFPGSVSIVVSEYSTVAFELSPKGELTAMLSNGAIVRAGSDIVVDKPILSGWKADDPHKVELSKKLAELPAESLSDFSEIIPSPSKAYPDRIKIYTRTRFEVVTAISVLQDKISSLDAVIETQEPGIITMLLADTYVPFVPEEAENEDSE